MAPNNTTNILNHVWQTILKPKWIYLIGVVIIGTGVAVAVIAIRKASSPLAPSTGPEGTEIALTFTKPKNVTLPQQVTAKFYDAGEHGYYAVHNGAGTYVAYDPTTQLTYTSPATAAATDSKHIKYTTTVPSGICGLIIQSSQQQNPPPKVVEVSLVGSDGKTLTGTKPASFKLKCDKYTLSIKIKTSADPVLPDGADQSTITANLSVKGPAQFVNGVRVKPSDPKITIVTPLAFVMTHFTTDLGALAPNPANVKTDTAGNAVVTITSPDAGIATVRAIASGIGDASIKVHFKPKLTAVTEVFVQPNSPTNYQMTTIPANPKDLTFDWALIRPAGAACGSLTGPANGLAESKNGFFHGPTADFKDGCDAAYEAAMQVQVTVTDKDGQSDSKTFSARGFEGMGPVKLP